MRTRLKYLLPVVLMLTLVGNLKGQGVDPGTQNLTHSWTFDDGTANDYIGHANGTLIGNAYISGGSLLTDYTDSWMQMPADTIAINTYNEITLEAWFRPFENLNTDFHMLAFFGDTKNTVGVNYYFITPARGDDKSRAGISCGVESSPWTGESGANGPEYGDGEIHHMVSTLNATTITLYIDGVLQDSSSLATNNSINRISPVHAYLAKSGYDGDATWKGEIFEFNTYNRALSAEEILFLSHKRPITAVDEGKSVTLPQKYSLLQNYPNPFNPSTLISFGLPENSFVSLKVYNSLGVEIAELAGREFSAGRQIVRFDASNLASGVYFYTIRTGNYTSTQKMVFQK